MTALAPPVTTEQAAGGGLRIWFAAFGPVGAWIVHFLACVALAREACLDDRWTWVMHATTAVTAAFTLACTWLSWGVVRQGRRGAVPAAQASQARFLGRFGVLVGLVNLVLILVEGSMVAVIDACAH